jgi:hypothetical protein
MAASDRFLITIQVPFAAVLELPLLASPFCRVGVFQGKGGHGAVPQGTADAILAVSHLITQLHSIVSRNIDRKSPWCLARFVADCHCCLASARRSRDYRRLRACAYGTSSSCSSSFPFCCLSCSLATVTT